MARCFPSADLLEICRETATVPALVLTISFAGSVVAGPFEDAGTAFMKGDYAKSSRLLRPLAEQGDADARARLALMLVWPTRRATMRRRCSSCVPLLSRATLMLKLV
jgi:hypothetical protein